ncbi:MAG TPA: aldose epimerase family protein [Sphingomonas sp.]|jgi:aldose 1-epimerase|nr:aldose epimerase family protein [Sphingomonas sp.]
MDDSKREHTATRSVFGHLPDGREVAAVTLANPRGLSITVIAYGATVQSVILPDRNGNVADVALGHSTLDGYLAKRQYFGATVGRFANRIAAGRFTLDGRDCHTPCNDGANALHGGDVGFDMAVWTIADCTASSANASVTLRHISPDGDQGYPGRLTVDCTYTLNAHDTLTIDHRATTDAPTIVSITNHTYWNLAGEGSPAGAMGHVVTLFADDFLPTDAGAIPTGEVRPVEGTPFDFRQPHSVGARVRDANDPQIAIGRGYDHTWVFGDAITPDVRPMARVIEPQSGRGFDLSSNQPGLQFYSGNFLDATSRGKANQLYRAGDAIVFEPQSFPDTPNHPAFGSARLAPGETYRNTIVYRFTTDALT